MLFKAYNDNTPKYLVRNQRINQILDHQILDGWDVHHQCFGFIQNDFSRLNRCSPWSWSTLNAFDRFEEKSSKFIPSMRDFSCFE